VYALGLPFAVNAIAGLSTLAPVWVLLLRDVIASLVLLAVVVWWERAPLASLGWRMPSPREWLLVIPAVALASAAGELTLLFPLHGGGVLVAAPVWLATLRAITAASFEELFFRGYAITRLERLGAPTWLAIVVPTLVFGFAHFRLYGFNLSLLVPLTIGLLFALLFAWRRNLPLCIVSHALVDIL